MAEAVSEKSTEREGDGARTTRRGSAEVLQRFFISKVAGVQTRFDKKRRRELCTHNSMRSSELVSPFFVILSMRKSSIFFCPDRCSPIGG